MYPYITVFGIDMQSWFLLTFIGYISVLVGMLTTMPQSRSLTRPKIALSSFLYVLAAILGASLVSVIAHPEILKGMPPGEVISHIGIAYIGEPIFGLLAVLAVSRLAKFSFFDFVDLASPYSMLARAMSRIGCLLAGCCYGIATTLPWGFNFLGDGLLRHPTQGYAMIAAFAIFGSARFIYKNLRQFKGLVFFYVDFMYCFFRFFNEFLRQEGPYLIGQIKVLHPLLLIGMVVFAWGIRYSLLKADKKQLEEVKEVFKGALARLVIWMACSSGILLLVMHTINRIWG